VWYNPHDVISAWDLFITGVMTEPSLTNASNFRHDMVDLTRQSMQEIFHLLYSKLLMVYLEKNSTAIGYNIRTYLKRHEISLFFSRGIAYKMIDLLQDLDELLQTGSKFLLGKWIADAKSWGLTEGVCLILHDFKNSQKTFYVKIYWLKFKGKDAIRVEC
jgi:alpha-N-acetylglucosaminidase